MNNPSLKENDHSTMLVPYTYYECTVPKDFSFVPLHWHNEFEINYILNGTANFNIGDKSFLSKAGDIFIIPPDVSHSIYQDKTLPIYYKTIVFSESLFSVSSGSRSDLEFLQQILDGKIELPLYINENNSMYLQIKTAVESAMKCAKSDYALNDMLLKSELLRLLWLIIKSGTVQKSNSVENIHSAEIQNTIQYIKENISADFTIEQLAKFSNLSRSHFMSKFKQETGKSAINYINDLRIKEACNHLISTRKNISEIAFECGFHNIANFNRHFLSGVGCSPKEYRKSVIIHLYNH